MNGTADAPSRVGPEDLLRLARLSLPYAHLAHRGRGDLDRAELLQEASSSVLAVLAEDPNLRPDRDVDAIVPRARRRIESFLRAERRRKGRTIPLSTMEAEGWDPPDPTEPPAVRDDEPRLRAALARLSPRQRAILVRLYWQSVSADEVARAERTSVEAVQKARRRAEASLGRILRARPD